MPPLARDVFFAVHAPHTTRVEVPELGGFVFVRAMTAGDRDRFEAEHASSKQRDFRARLVVASVCDETASLVFGPADVAALSALPASSLEPIVRAAVRINALSDDDVRDLEKNS